MSAHKIDNMIDALLETKSGEQIVAARNAIGLAFDEMERKQARLVGTVTAMQSSLAELAFIDSREAELGLRRYKPTQSSPTPGDLSLEGIYKRYQDAIDQASTEQVAAIERAKRVLNAELDLARAEAADADQSSPAPS